MQIKSYDDISVAQYIELQELLTDNDNIDDVELVSVLTDQSIEEVEEMPYDLFIEVLNSAALLPKKPSGFPKPSLKIRDIDLYLINLDKITVGEFIDLMNFTKKSVPNLTKILSILYRRKLKQDDLFLPDQFEPYGDFIDHRSKLFLDVPISYVYGVIAMWLAFEKNLFEQFDGLFETTENEEDDDYEADSISRMEALQEKQKEQQFRDWSWDIFLYQLAKMNNCTFEEATTLPVVLAFGLHAMRKTFKLTI